MSEMFNIIKEDKNYCSSCSTESSCQLLKFINNIAKRHRVPLYNNRFGCTEFTVQPLKIDFEEK